MSVGLLYIETRRTIAVWLVPLMAALAWWVIARPQLGATAEFWPDRSVQILHLAAQIGPLLAAAGAWMAGRNRRRKIEDQIGTTAYVPWLRELVTCTAVVIWGLVVYCVMGSYIAGATAVQDAWGAPTAGPILVGLLAVPAQAAIGYAIGYRFPNRFTAPLVAIALFVAQNVAGAKGPLEWYHFLSPGISYNTSILFGTFPDLTNLQILYVLGLAGIAVSSLGVTGTWKLAARSLLLGSLVLTSSSVLLIQRDGHGGPFSAAGITPQQFARQLIPFRPVCASGRLPVCVHPAFKDHLATIARTVNRVAGPILGIPGSPTRALDSSIFQVIAQDSKGGANGYWKPIERLLRKKGMTVYTTRPSGVLALSIDPAQDLGSTFASQVAGGLVSGTDWPVEQCDPTGCGGPGGPAQEAIAVWLVQRAGFGVQWSELNRANSSIPDENVLAAARRFAALPSGRQHAWLDTNFRTLRQGQVNLAALP